MVVFDQPWGLLALAGLPAVAAIYFFRRRFRPVPVAGLFLWPPGDALPPSGRRRSRIEAPLTLLLELLAVLLLAALLSGARWEHRAAVPHAVVVLDRSASMAASAERAARETEKICAALGPLDSVRLTVLLSGPMPEVIAGPMAPAPRGLEALAAPRPLLPRHALRPALDLAHRLAEGGGAIYLVTDHPSEAAGEADAGVRVRGVGRPQDNAALTLAAWGPDASVVAVRVANYGAAAARTLTLSEEGGRKLKEERLALAPGEERSVAWTVETEAEILRVRLEGADALAWDDEAALLSPLRREVSIRCTLPEGSRAGRDIERACRAVPDVLWLEPGGRDRADLVIAASGASDAPWRLEIGPPEAEWRAGEALAPLLGPYVADAGHPLMEEMDFRGVVWSGAVPFREDAPAAPLLSAGEAVLIFERLGRDPGAFGLNADLERSNLHKSPAWPLLFYNLVRLRRDALPGLAARNVRVGERVSYRFDPDAEGQPFSAAGPDGLPLPVIRLADRVEILDTWTPGISVLRHGPATERFAANLLDAGESDLRGAHDAAPAPETAPGREALYEEESSWPWAAPLLCLGLLGLLIADLAAARRAAGEAA